MRITNVCLNWKQQLYCTCWTIQDRIKCSIVKVAMSSYYYVNYYDVTAYGELRLACNNTRPSTINLKVIAYGMLYTGAGVCAGCTYSCQQGEYCKHWTKWYTYSMNASINPIAHITDISKPLLHAYDGEEGKLWILNAPFSCDLSYDSHSSKHFVYYAILYHFQAQKFNKFMFS